jgi:hypothetical protein
MFCRIYVYNKEIEGGELLDEIREFLNVELVDGKYIEKEYFSLEVRPNDEFDLKKSTVFPDGFLYFPCSVEIDFAEEYSIKEASHTVGDLLKFLWMRKYPAVASCEFEELLPENGGYKSTNVPWVGNMQE